MAYWDASRHRKYKIYTVDHQPLLVELARCVVPRTCVVDGDERGGVPYFGSRPAARLDAIDLLARIRGDVGEWCMRLDLGTRRAVASDLRLMLVAALKVSNETLGRMASDARGWANSAKVITGEESAAYAPHVDCPACGEVGGIRIRLSERLGVCLKCGAHWDDSDGGIYILAGHIRLAGEAAG